MKIILLHGEDTIKSYERLKKFIDTAKNRSWEVVNVDQSPTSFEETLSSTSLFGNERFFILRDIKKIGKKESIWLEKNYKLIDGNLIVYHEGTAGVTFVKSLTGSVVVEEFALPKLIWAFLDDIKYGNSTKCLQDFHKIIKRDAPEFVFTLISKLFKDLYWVKVDSASMPYPQWRIDKLKRQSAGFTPDQLLGIINSLAEIDVSVKTGNGDIVSALDLMLIKQLK